MRTTGPGFSHTDIETLQKIELGARLKPANHARDDHDLPRLSHLRERTDQLMRAYSQDDANHQPLVASRLALEIGGHLKNQRRYDNEVGLDRVGLANFTQRRNAVLRSIQGAQAIASQYGQSFAPELERASPYPSLRIGNENDVVYHREAPGKSFQAALKELYARRSGGTPEGYEVAFVNSGYTLIHLLSMLKNFPSAANVPPSKELAEGIIALHYPPKYASQLHKLIRLLGAHPSTYQVRRALSGNLPPIAAVATVDNRRTVESLKPSQPSSPTRRLRLASPTEGTGAMAHTAADLVDDLCNVLVISGRLGQDQDRRNPLLAQGLAGLREHLEDMNALHNDSMRFGNAYRAMMEELHVVLATAQPYELVSFKHAALHHLESTSRMDPALSAKLKKPETYLATSAMNAIIQGLEIAAIFGEERSFTLLSTDRHGETPLYYEAEQLLMVRGQRQSDTSRTLLASLNFSYPEANGRHPEPWGVSAVIDATRSQVSNHRSGEPPFVLVLDTTVEHLSDLHQLTGALSHELATGKLQIAVCKSYQKYSNLCSSKVVSGSITLLGANSEARLRADEYLHSVEQSTNWMGNDEAQLMTHFLRAGHQEFRLLERAVANAAFVRDTCFTGEGDHASFDGYHPNLPFGMALMHTYADSFVYPTLKVRDAAGEVINAPFMPTDNFDVHVVRPRDSFGFSETVQAHMPELDGYDDRSVRLSFGQESKAELTEMFYMPSRLMRPEGSHFGVQEARDHISELVLAALTPEQRRTTTDKTLAHKLALVAANQAPRLDDNQRQAGSVAGMRRALEGQNTRQAFTLNKVASVIGHLGNLARGEKLLGQLAGGADREMADQLLDGLMGSNMPGVSGIGRETVAQFYTALCEADMHSDNPERRQKGVRRLIDGLARMPVANTRGAYVDTVPDAVFETQPVELRQRLLDLVFRPLGKRARLELIERHLNTHQLSFAESCIDIVEREDAGHTPRLAEHLDQRRTELSQIRVRDLAQSTSRLNVPSPHRDA